MRFLLEALRDLIFGPPVVEIIHEPSVDGGHCHHCHDDVGYLAMAGLVIRYGKYEFCSEFCLESWMDSLDREAGRL